VREEVEERMSRREEVEEKKNGDEEKKRNGGLPILQSFPASFVSLLALF